MIATLAKKNIENNLLQIKLPILITVVFSGGIE